MKRKLNRKLFCLGFIPSLIIVSLVLLIFNILLYPLSRQKIHEKMEFMPVVASYEEQGIFAYVMYHEEVSLAFRLEARIFTKSMFISRFRLSSQMYFGVESDTSTILVPGERNHVVLELSRNSIQVLNIGGRRLQTNHAISFFAMTICINSLFYSCANSFWKKKRLKHKANDSHQK